jgi:hypothetical protein
MLKTFATPGLSSTLMRVLWLLVCINMWGFAVIGPLFVVFGLLSFSVDFGESMSMAGEPVATNMQKTAWTILIAAFGGLGLSFVGLQLSGRLKLIEPADK